jgi:RNA polymerase sigma-54 factor
MALSTRLDLRQSQSLVMTPQLLQAIKLLQFSAVELQDYVEGELEKNPMLERAEDDGEPARPDVEAFNTADWTSDAMATSAAAAAREFGMESEVAFPEERAATAPATQLSDPGNSLVWEGTRGGSFSLEDDPDLEAYVGNSLSLHDHLEKQLLLVPLGEIDRRIAGTLIQAIDDCGYLSEPLDELAQKLGVPIAQLETILGSIQQLEPAGIGARNLAECLALQLKERDRLDPAMQVLIDHLDLVGARDFQRLKRLAKVDDEDFAEMLAEIRRLDPKPGLAFGGRPPEPVIPDVFVIATSNGGWRVDLNSAALPRVLANKSYYAEVNALTKDKQAKAFIEDAWQNANWLTRSLEQRARTILKVASEIVRQQDQFFLRGVTYLRPMNLKSVAEQVGLHESTISRVTANKFLVCPRGIFEMKYFFTSAIASSQGSDFAHSAEAVRHHIKTMIESEKVDDVLSDDALVDKLKKLGIDIARRTVAKYREAMHIPSSAMRRREMRALG